MTETILHCESIGDLNAPVIVFLHGFMGRADSFRQMMTSLADRFRCIALDLPGHGVSLFSTSGRIAALNNIQDTADLVVQDLDALNVHSFSLYGYSMGGRIAQHIAIASPERIDRLILESASFGIPDIGERGERYKNDHALLAKVESREDFRVFLAGWYQMPLFKTLSGTVHEERLIEDKLNHPVTEYSRGLQLLSVGGHEYLADKLSACGIRIYYFCGELDGAYMQTAQNVKARLPDMTIRIFRGASHNIHIQYPDEIIRAIQEIMV